MKLKHEKGLCCFTLIIFILYFISGIFLTSCGMEEKDPAEKVSSGKETTLPAEDYEPNADPNEMPANKEMEAHAEEKEPVSLPEAGGNQDDLQSFLPKPASLLDADWYCGIYYSDISYQAVEDYLDQLQEAGWNRVEEKDWNSVEGNGVIRNIVVSDRSKLTTHIDIPTGITQLMLSDGKSLLQLIIAIGGKDSTMNNSVLLRLEEGVSAETVENREGALTKKSALELLQPEVDRLVESGEISVNRQKINGLLELFIEDAYEKMGLQAFTAVSDNGVIGIFLLCNGRALHVPGYLEETCVADLDGNGRYELLDLFGFGSGIYRIELSAYEYSNPIYFSSPTEILHRKYYNCLIPEQGYGELFFHKVSNSEVGLTGSKAYYGKLVIEDSYLIPENIEGFPFKQWKDSYDQKLLEAFDKEIPKEAPEIIISIDGRALDYHTQETRWDGMESSYTTSELFRNIREQGKFLPTYCISSMVGADRYVELNFGDSIPDTILVKDAMMEESGGIRYGTKLVMDREVEILDDSRVRFGLTQHMAYFLSSNSGDYEKDWYRCFHVICTWGENEAVYTFVINTGSEDKITEIEDHDFLMFSGNYSMLSSSWGIGFQINPVSKDLPEEYFTEWQVSGGELKVWKEEDQKPVYINDKHHGYPITFSGDGNGGAVIWSPFSYEEGDEATIKAYVYRSINDRSPIAVSEITLICENGIWKEKN